MRAIRRKIYFVTVMLVAALALSVAIFIKDNRLDNDNSLPIDNKAIIDDNGASRLGGDKLFKANCAPCHTMDKNLIGPALRGIRDRMPDKLFEAFLLDPQKTVSASKYLQNLYARYDNIPHISFLGTLNKKDVEAIMMYCDTSDPMFKTELRR